MEEIKFNWDHSIDYLTISINQRIPSELKTNSFIYSYNSRLINYFIEDIKTHLPYLQELTTETIDAVKSILLFKNIITVQAYIDSRGFDFNKMIDESISKKINVTGFSIKIFDHEIGCPEHNIIIYPYKASDVKFIEEKYDDLVFNISYEVLSTALLILSLSKSSSIQLVRKTLDTEVLHQEQLSYIKGDLKEFKKAEELFIKFLRYVYSQIVMSGVRVTDQAIADEMGIPRNTYRDFMHEKYKLEIDKETGTITKKEI